jgi:Na+-transporting NADH:ubiquinone oxidoreductase subunit B
MRALRRYLDRLQPLFDRGGRFEQFSAVFEMVDTLLYTPADVTRDAPHVRDAMDLKRLMIFVVLAVTPALLVGIYNTGYQANLAMGQLGLSMVPGWRGDLLGLFGIGFSADSIWACLVHGLLYFLPIYLITLIAGGLWEVMFAAVRNHEVNEGFLVTSMLFSMTLPPTIPLWQVAIGISFGVVIGKEVFGGTGKNFLNPALTGRAFLFFAYPGAMRGEAVWTALDGYTGATPLAIAAAGGLPELHNQSITWAQAFLGQISGSLGETSTLACLLGAAMLVFTRIASWRIMAGVFIGMVGTVLLFNTFGSDSNPMTSLPWYWHFVLGGYAFGMVFMATDPVSAAMTDAGRWVYGLLIGAMVVLIRVANPAFPEGMMLAILFANVFAPLIDYAVVRIHVRARARQAG